MELRDLQRMTVIKLREEALQHAGLEGVHAMTKKQLLVALAPRFGIDLDAAKKTSRAKVATDKTSLKQEIRGLKKQRDTALAEHDAATVKETRQGIKTRKRVLRRLAEQVQATTT